VAEVGAAQVLPSVYAQALAVGLNSRLPVVVRRVCGVTEVLLVRLRCLWSS
jgi:hypothetical protein